MSLPHGLVSYGPGANCTLALCPASASVYGYRPSLSANIIFAIFFGILLILHIWRSVIWKEWFFMSSMILGCAAEIIGYIGRIMLWQNPFSFNGFMIQICCITFAPVFYCAAIYVLLSRVVVYLDPRLSRFTPKLWLWIFLPCDIVSLALQGAGGGNSSTSKGANPVGVKMSIAGLSFQVITLFFFCVACLDYAFRYVHSPSRQRPLPKAFKRFIAWLTAAILCIFIRCAYRIQELRKGYHSKLMANEGLFIALEGALIVLAAISLLFAHPGPAFENRTSLAGTVREHGSAVEKGEKNGATLSPRSDEEILQL